MVPIRVVLVDDHRVVRRGLASFLTAFADIEVVGEASSGEELLEHLEDWLPDVVVMDLLMPGGINGLEATKRTRALCPNTRVVVLTAYTDNERVLAALRAGAIGYVRKDRDPESLLAAIRMGARGQSLLDPAVAGSLLQLMQGGLPENSLTEREKEVLLQITRGLTNREIAEHFTISEETVKTHVGNILTKLQLDHRAQAIIYALKQGLISLDEID